MYQPTDFFFLFGQYLVLTSQQLSDDWADDKIEVDGTNGCLRACAALKQRFAHLKVILSIGGSGKGGEHFAQVAADAVKRETFASTARQLVDSYRLDGVDSNENHPDSRLPQKKH